ncbi:MAG: DUF2809 domain-containing protein [Fibrobacterota bacterium]
MFDAMAGFVYEDEPEEASGRVFWKSLLALNLVTGFGLASRRWDLFPTIFGKYPGDALWALMVYLLIGMVRRKMSSSMVAALALATCFAVEFAQLYHAPWIESVRATRMGYLALGTTFNPMDLVAYAMGVAAGLVTESVIQCAGLPSGPPISD